MLTCPLQRNFCIQSKAWSDMPVIRLSLLFFYFSHSKGTVKQAHCMPMAEILPIFKSVKNIILAG